MTRIIDIADLAHSETAYEFQGYHHDAGVSFIVELTPPVIEALMGSPNIYPTALHAASTSMLHRLVKRLSHPYGTGTIQDPGYGVPRTLLPLR